MANADTRTELNRLYWESDASVSEIARRLDISRRALYDGIEPLPAGRPCPECGAPLTFRNRTAEEDRKAECPECGYETELEPERAGSKASAAGRPAADRVAPALPDVGSGPLLGSAFVTGLALGAAVTYLLHRR